jgi:phosphotriesterase-related protein
MQAVCVRGMVDASALGIMLPHEHLNTDARFLCQAQSLERAPITAILLADLKRRPMDYLDNLDMREEPTVIEEAARFGHASGRTIVDLTTNEIGRDPALLARISTATGLNVIMATGFYVRQAHPDWLADAPVETIAELFVREIRDGIDGVHAGVIGEIGTGDPLDPQEAKVVRAAAQAHLQTGCPINVHFAAKCREVFTVLEILRAEGVTDFSRVVISHMDVAIDLEQQRAVAEWGANVEYDTFGHEAYPDSKGNLMPRDEGRVDALAQLDAWGLLPRVLVSHDVCMKSLWRRYGGFGYTNLLDRVRPMMTAVGLSDEAQRQLLLINPSRVFAFAD